MCRIDFNLLLPLRSSEEFDDEEEEDMDEEEALAEEANDFLTESERPQFCGRSGVGFERGGERRRKSAIATNVIMIPVQIVSKETVIDTC